MGTAVNHPVPDRVKPSFVIFDIWALWRSGLSVRVPGCQKYKWRLNPVWHRMLYSCTNMAAVDVKGLSLFFYVLVKWLLLVHSLSFHLTNVDSLCTAHSFCVTCCCDTVVMYNFSILTHLSVISSSYQWHVCLTPVGRLRQLYWLYTIDSILSVVLYYCSIDKHCRCDCLDSCGKWRAEMLSVMC